MNEPETILEARNLFEINSRVRVNHRSTALQIRYVQPISAFSKPFVFGVLFPKLTEHSWYVNNTSSKNEDLVKSYFGRENPRHLLEAICRCEVQYFVPLRVVLESLALAVENFCKEVGEEDSKTGRPAEGVATSRAASPAARNSASVLSPSNRSRSRLTARRAEFEKISKGFKRTRDFWRASEFARAVSMLEKTLRSMPRAARPRILHLLTRIFVNNFDVNSVQMEAAGPRETRRAHDQRIPSIHDFSGVFRTGAGESSGYNFYQGSTRNADDNHIAAELLQRHVLLVRFFAAIPNDLACSRVYTSNGGGPTSSCCAYVEFDEVFRGLFLWLLHEEEGSGYFSSMNNVLNKAASGFAGDDAEIDVEGLHREDATLIQAAEFRARHLEQVDRLIARQSRLQETRTLALGLARILIYTNVFTVGPITDQIRELHARIDRHDHFLPAKNVARQKILKDEQFEANLQRYLARQKRLVQDGCLRRLADVVEGLYDKPYTNKTVAQTAVLLFNLLQPEGLLSAHSASWRTKYMSSSPGPPARTGCSSSTPAQEVGTMSFSPLAVSVDTDKLTHWIFGCGQDGERTWDDVSLFATALYLVQIPDELLRPMTEFVEKRLIVSGAPPGGADEEQESSGASRRSPSLKKSRSDDPTWVFPGLAFAGALLRSLQGCRDSADVILQGRLAKVLAGWVLKALNFKGFKVLLAEQNNAASSQAGGGSENRPALLRDTSKMQVSDFAAQYYAKYAVQPAVAVEAPVASPIPPAPIDKATATAPSLPPVEPSTTNTSRQLEHYFSNLLENIVFGRGGERLSTDTVRLLQEGFFLGGDWKNKMNVTTARMSLEWHRWRSLYALHACVSETMMARTVGSGGGFALADLLEAFEMSSPPEAGWIAQIIGEKRAASSTSTSGGEQGRGPGGLERPLADPNTWTLDLLQQNARIVGGLLKDPANTGYDYAILSEACFAAFNVNTLGAELQLMGSRAGGNVGRSILEDDDEDRTPSESGEVVESSDNDAEGEDVEGSTATLQEERSDGEATPDDSQAALLDRALEGSNGRQMPRLHPNGPTYPWKLVKTKQQTKEDHLLEMKWSEYEEFSQARSGSTPLLNLLSKILTAGETQVNVTRAALLPLLGSLSEIMKTRQFSTLPPSYAQLLARLLIYNEAVLRDGSYTLGEAETVPASNVVKGVTKLAGGVLTPGTTPTPAHQEPGVERSDAAVDCESSFSEGENVALMGTKTSAETTSSRPGRESSAYTYTKTVTAPSVAAQQEFARLHLSQSSAFVRITTLCFLEKHPALATSVAFALIAFLDEQAQTSAMRVAKKKTKTGAVSFADDARLISGEGRGTKAKAGDNKGKNAAKPLVPNNLSDYHRAQLRAWQAIVVLMNVIQPNWLGNLVPRIMYHFGLPQLPDVRSYIEYSLCVLAEREQARREAEIDWKAEKNKIASIRLGKVSEYFTASLTDILEQVGTGTPQVIASAILVAGYWAENTELLSRRLLLDRLLLPYLTSNVALVRGTAQLVFFRLYTFVQNLGVAATGRLEEQLHDEDHMRLLGAPPGAGSSSPLVSIGRSSAAGPVVERRERRVLVSDQFADEKSRLERETRLLLATPTDSSPGDYDRYGGDASPGASATDERRSRRFVSPPVSPAPAAQMSDKASSPLPLPSASPYHRTIRATVRNYDFAPFHEQLLRMLVEHKDNVKMRERLASNFDHWRPKHNSQMASVFNSMSTATASAFDGGSSSTSSVSGVMNGQLEAIYDFLPSKMFLTEMRSLIDAEMQSLWYKHTEQDEKVKVGPNGYIWVDETEGLLEELRERVKQQSSCASEISSSAVVPAASAAHVSLQRKFDPFAGGEQQLDDLFFAQFMQSQKSALEPGSCAPGGSNGRPRTRSNLIVVASLIDKAPNLAGLCRTCEIFSAECLVVNNKDVVKDPAFQSVSVTAEKWLPMREVGANAIAEYLCLQAQLGYRIVGVEQTHNSICLTEFAFFPSSDVKSTSRSTGGMKKGSDHNDGKVVLLLGAEKEGLPADLIHACDYTVEIPQSGIIRSLNVHVSGALCVWEYTRQRMKWLKGMEVA